MEILLVLLITSVLILGLNGVYKLAFILWSRAELNRPICQKTRIFFETLRQELTCLYLPKGTAEQQLTGFSLSSLPDGATQLTFYTLTPSWLTSPEYSLPAKLSYKFSVNSENEQKLLTRTEEYFSGEKSVSSAAEDVIFQNLDEFKVWAIDPNSDSSEDSWKDNIDCKNAPPKAVKIELRWPQKANLTQDTFQTVIIIQAQAQLSSQ